MIIADRTAPRRTNDSKIAQARLAAGLTQAQLAERAGVGASSLGHWECGERIPKLASLRRIAAALEIPWQDLLED